jgi:hypothetical protein
MKRVMILVLLLFSVSFVFAESACDLEVTLLSQDPYPAVPGNYVKLVFQLSGLDSPDCDDISFELLSGYPVEFNPGETGLRSFKKIDYIKDYESSILIPYEIRLDENALDGSNEIEVSIQNKGDAKIVKSFDLETQDVRVEFETYVTNYNYATRELTIEVLNIGDSDIEALTMEIPKQDGISIKGSNRIVVGDLDSNEYTSADFEAIPADGDFTINLIYSDSINVRRATEQMVNFDSSYFTGRVADQPKKMGTGSYIGIGAALLLIIYIISKKIKKARKNKK